jgi:hypothetical protein
MAPAHLQFFRKKPSCHALCHQESVTARHHAVNTERVKALVIWLVIVKNFAGGGEQAVN